MGMPLNAELGMEFLIGAGDSTNRCGIPSWRAETEAIIASERVASRRLRKPTKPSLHSYYAAAPNFAVISGLLS